MKKYILVPYDYNNKYCITMSISIYIYYEDKKSDLLVCDKESGDVIYNNYPVLFFDYNYSTKMTKDEFRSLKNILVVDFVGCVLKNKINNDICVKMYGKIYNDYKCEKIRQDLYIMYNVKVCNLNDVILNFDKICRDELCNCGKNNCYNNCCCKKNTDGNPYPVIENSVFHKNNTIEYTKKDNHHIGQDSPQNMYKSKSYVTSYSTQCGNWNECNKERYNEFMIDK